MERNRGFIRRVEAVLTLKKRQMSANELLQLTSFLLVFVSLLFVFFLLTVPSENKVGNRLIFYL